METYFQAMEYILMVLPIYLMNKFHYTDDPENYHNFHFYLL
jgi:hypothetical protein